MLHGNAGLFCRGHVGADVEGVYRSQHGAPKAFDPRRAHALTRGRPTFARDLYEYRRDARLIERALFANGELERQVGELAECARRTRIRACLLRDRVLDSALQLLRRGAQPERRRSCSRIRTRARCATTSATCRTTCSRACRRGRRARSRRRTARGRRPRSRVRRRRRRCRHWWTPARSFAPSRAPRTRVPAPAEPRSQTIPRVLPYPAHRGVRRSRSVSRWSSRDAARPPS